MTSAQELVAVFDEDGRPRPGVPRGRMREGGLWHACATILVRSPDGRRVYVHRRTDTKDVYPGLYDCWAGGVLADGETSDACAERELAEELGVRGVPLTRSFVARFVDPPIRYTAHVYEVRTDGPFTHQPEEVAEGWWMDLDDLRGKVDDPDWPLVPDGRALFHQWLARQGA
ncbi:NUDIX hydrolase [Umezawaea endophytica]|uniref:NUDIX domain-containing protein n=1 Tax=Umezawaea endophytica TaxID=1654476 RepID=A0A9X3AJU6_9PSEU|nr:NUDIX domain-containing protein [Umezawaea endophytica]MCS7484546.1 NUDIX domain-containing protein [Umezawaea endophytica]